MRVITGIDAPKGVAEAIEKQFPELKNENLTLVFAEMKLRENDLLSHAKGINKALEIKDEVIILLSMLPPHALDNYEEFITLINRPGVGYGRIPETFLKLEEMYEHLKKDKRSTNKVAEKIKELRDQGHFMSRLRHDASHDHLVGEVIKSARQKGLSGTDEEILAKINNWEPPKQKFQGKSWDGVFCDIEGTLISHGKIIDETLDMLKNNEQEGKPITLWTGASTKKYQEQLLKNGIFWPLVSKNDFTGSTVEIAIDDMPEKDFADTYHINTGKYIKV